jgi:hypothetical protein
VIEFLRTITANGDVPEETDVKKHTRQHWKYNEINFRYDIHSNHKLDHPTIADGRTVDAALSRPTRCSFVPHLSTPGCSDKKLAPCRPGRFSSVRLDVCSDEHPFSNPSTNFQLPDQSYQELAVFGSEVWHMRMLTKCQKAARGSIEAIPGTNGDTERPTNTPARNVEKTLVSPEVI